MELFVERILGALINSNVSTIATLDTNYRMCYTKMAHIVRHLLRLRAYSQLVFFSNLDPAHIAFTHGHCIDSHTYSFVENIHARLIFVCTSGFNYIGVYTETESDEMIYKHNNNSKTFPMYARLRLNWAKLSRMGTEGRAEKSIALTEPILQ